MARFQVLDSSGHYERLGVDPQASNTAIKAAWHRQCLRWHPDRWSQASPPERDRATANFRLVCDSYNILAEESSRARYDEALEAELRENNDGLAAGEASPGVIPTIQRATAWSHRCDRIRTKQ